MVIHWFDAGTIVRFLGCREFLGYFFYFVFHSLEQGRVPSPWCRVIAHKVFVILQLKIIKTISHPNQIHSHSYLTQSSPHPQNPHKNESQQPEKHSPIISKFPKKQIKNECSIKLNLIMKMQELNEQPQICYFCKEADIDSCVTRSLYHKYNDSSNKILKRIDQIVEVAKEKSITARKFQEIKHIVDDNDHLSKYTPSSKASAELKDLLEYYKFRRFVPIFAKSLDNIRITEELHVYYYDKLKLYYNQIKKRLNITVDQSSVSESSHSFITRTQISDRQSRILNEITIKPSKEEIRAFQTESKALQGLLNVLKKNEDRLKKIKSLRTQDCTAQPNPFKDNIQRKSNLISYLASQNRNMAKKSKKIFFKYIEESKAQRNIESVSRLKGIKKMIGQSKANLFYESLKIRSNSQNIFKLRRDNSKIHAATNQRILFRNKAILQRTQRKSCDNLLQRQVIKSLPKVQMQINPRPSRSMSSASISHPTHQIPKKSTIKKQIDYAQHIQIIRTSAQKDQKKKRMIIKNPKVEIDQNDNIASITRKKIEELKLKSQKKKDGRK